MSKYTSNDPEVTYLSPADRINYEYDLLKHDVEQNVEFTEGRRSLALFSTPEKIKDQFKNPRQLSSTIVTIMGFVLLAVIIAFTLVYLRVKSQSDESMKDTFDRMIWYCALLFILLAIGFWFYNKIVNQVNMVGLLIK